MGHWKWYLSGIFAGIIFAFILIFNIDMFQKADASTENKIKEIDQLHTDLSNSEIRKGLSLIFESVAKIAEPSVVNIRIEKSVSLGPFPYPGPEFYSRGAGSGIIVSRDGYVLTNNHVVEKSENIFVSLSDGREFTAEIVGFDNKTDIALLKMDNKKATFVPVIFGNSSDVNVGEWVLAVGNPLGLQNTLTTGVVSALSRSSFRMDRRDSYQNYIQTDASINRGNSGGPLFNLKGEVIGMNTAILTDSESSRGSIGLGFAIPSNMVTFVYEQLKKNRTIQRGYFGIMIQNMNPEAAKELGIDTEDPENFRGVYVSEVLKNTPAGKGGIKKGDIIVKLNGEEVYSTPQLRSQIAMITPGEDAEVIVIRGKSRKKLTVKVGKKGDITGRAGSVEKEFFGMALETLSPQTALEHGYNEGLTGVLVRKVKRGSPAEKAGIEVFDVIIKVGRRDIGTVQDFEKSINKFSLKQGIPLVVFNGQGSYGVTLRK